jgi:hypothetical protein
MRRVYLILALLLFSPPRLVVFWWKVGKTYKVFSTMTSLVTVVLNIESQSQLDPHAQDPGAVLH